MDPAAAMSIHPTHHISGKNYSKLLVVLWLTINDKCTNGSCSTVSVAIMISSHVNDYDSYYSKQLVIYQIEYALDNIIS